MSAAAGSSVLASDGRRYTLGELLKSGGAGSIHRLRETSTLVAKLYHAQVDCAVYERKVQAMLSLSPDLPDLVEGPIRYVQIAWPTAILRDARGRFVGFLMPTVDVQSTSELECVLQERQARSLGLPTGLGAKVTLAANLAAVIAELHRRQHRVVDLKPVNLRFYPGSLYMAMLDCDGFSIQGQGERFPAPQFTTDYLAPEFQASGLTVAGEEQQDRFALAVIVFQLLNFGIHPYGGRPLSERVPTDIPGRIAGRFYPNGLQAHAQIQPNPGSGHEAMTTELRQLFDRAFQGPGAARPSALEWSLVLRAYAQRSSLRLAACARDRTHQHFTGQLCAACMRVELIAAAARDSRSAPARARAPLPPLARTKGARRIGAQPAQSPAARTTMKRRAMPPLQMPMPTPTPLMFPRSQNLTGAQAFWAILIVLILVVRGFSNSAERADAPGPSQVEAEPVAEPPPSTAAIASPAPVEDAAPTSEFVPIASLESLPRPAMWSELIETRKLVWRITLNTASSNELTRHLALDALAKLSSRHAAPATAPAPTALRWGAFMQALPNADEARRLQELHDTQVWLEAIPYDAEPVCEWAWTALLSGHRQDAEDAFIRAIWAQPDYPGGWYGLGAVAEDDTTRFGALATYEDLRVDRPFAQDPVQLAQFTQWAIETSGLDYQRFRILHARAQRKSAHARRQPVPPEVDALAEKTIRR